MFYSLLMVKLSSKSKTKKRGVENPLLEDIRSQIKKMIVTLLN